MTETKENKKNDLAEGDDKAGSKQEKDQKTDEVKDESSSSLEELQTDVANAYLKMKYDEKGVGASIAHSVLSGLGLNVFKKGARDYILAGTKAAESGDVSDKIGENISANITASMNNEQSEMFKLNISDLDAMKELITQYKDNKTKLEEIKAQIEEGKDPTKNSAQGTVSSDQGKQADAGNVAPYAAPSMMAAPETSGERKLPFKEEDKKKIRYNPEYGHFGTRPDPFNKTKRAGHNGIDLSAPSGTPLHSITGGVIEASGYGKGNGNYVKIKTDDGRKIFYLHMLEKPDFKTGDRIAAGQQIGKIGSTGLSTGPHLHLEVHDMAEKPVDPFEVYPELKKYAA